MIPEQMMDRDLTMIQELEITNTYKLLDDKIQGHTDNLDALQQAIYKILNTEKYEYPIYSFNYGIDLESLIGKDNTYVRIELKRRIEECLLQDERITDVSNFVFFQSGESLACTFYVTSVYGGLSVSKEVNV